MEKEKEKDEEKNNCNLAGQRRASRRKVKTGCSHCKSRKIRCDEARPQCLKWVKSGRLWGGYPAYRRTVNVAIPIAPSPQLVQQTAVLAVSPGKVVPRKQHLIVRPPRTPRKKIDSDLKPVI
ncbi:Zn2/Cys6 DNA-binding protein [Diplocarpon rosae]|nr:Zn2/Cys6 DNA-binding protein [Diplocarpon rosae]